MKTTLQKPAKLSSIKTNKPYDSLEAALEAKHKKANDFIKKVKLVF